LQKDRKDIRKNSAVCNYVRVMFAYSTDDKSNRFPYLCVRIGELSDEILKSRNNHIHKSYLLRPLSDRPQCYQRRVPFLPVLIVDVLAGKSQDWLHYVVPDDECNGSKAAHRRQTHTQFLVFVLLVLNAHSLDALNEQNDELAAAFLYVIADVGVSLLSLEFFLGK